MRHRKFTENGDTPILTLRRSPRFCQQNQQDSVYPKTPKSVSRQKRLPYSDLTPLSSILDEDSLNKSQKFKSSTRMNGGAQGFPCVRRSTRLSQNSNAEKIVGNGSVERSGSNKPNDGGSSNVSKKARGVDSLKRSLNVTEKRVTRSSTRESNNGGVTDNTKCCNILRKCISSEDRGTECVSDKGKEQGGVNLYEHCLHKVEKRVTRSASRGIQGVNTLKFGDVKGLSDDGKDKFGVNLATDPISECDDTKKCAPAADFVGGEGKRDVLEAEKKQVGAKRKKIQVEKEHRMFDGWTMEQELSLERAYFAAKATPHFWKKVAKMVPGKSAQECFDKIHSELMTPPQPQPRSRAKATKSPLSLSASKLLNSSVPETKKLRYKKQKSHLAHKTVRQLLKKQCNLDQDNDADLFSVLEQTLDPPTQIVQGNRLLSTPEPGFDKRCMERSSACRKHLSRLNNSLEADLTSPPVLKKIKNKALHEKYIDQLHSREAKRKAASLRARKFDKGENGVQKMEAAVKDAKNALVFCATDAINQFHHLQSSKVNNFDNTFDDFADTSENESEDGS